jgi:aldose 1-epimerase
MDPYQNQEIGEKFGVLPDGREVRSYNLFNAAGVIIQVLDYGCIINSLILPSNAGPIDVVLGFEKVDDYINAHSLPAPPYFGAVVGRYAGRIKNGKFKINDNEFQLNINNNSHTLHGGVKGLDQRLWSVIDYNDDGTSITFSYTSKAGEENFPGEMNIKVNYQLGDDNELSISYHATSTEDTIINLTQHSYFNLSGHKAGLEDHELFINAPQVIEIDAENIPSGKLIPAADKGFDFTTPRAIPHVIDDSFIIEDTSRPAAVLESKSSKIRLTVTSNQPSVHIYVGGNLFGRMTGKENIGYHPYSGICFESQNYPDAPNQPAFPNAVLRKGEEYTHATKWKFDFL